MNKHAKLWIERLMIINKDKDKHDKMKSGGRLHVMGN